jgi:hypothetical protein
VLRLAIPLLLLFFRAGATACEVIPLQEPLSGSTMVQLQPTLSWQGGADDRYRLQWVALLPEARVLASQDVEVVGTRFTLASAIASERAAMKVRITRGCAVDDPQELNAQGPAFFIDVRAGCSVDGRSFFQDGRSVRWASNPGAQRYRLRMFQPGLGDGPMTLLEERDLAEPRAVLNLRDGNTPGVAVLQAVCGGHAGPPAALVLQPLR